MSLEISSEDSSAPPSPANPPCWQPASERRIQANRQNALRSTGPKTERGKCAVARNAIQHGVLAREVVITVGDGKESLEGFRDLVGQLCECYEPVGIVEESLVQTIATCWWRKARVLRAENGEIRKRQDTLAADRALRNSEKASLDLEFDLALSEMGLEDYSPENATDPQVSPRDRCSALQAKQSELRRHLAGLAYMSQLLRTAKSEIASDGYMSLAGGSKFYGALYFWDYPLVSDFLSALGTKDPPSEKVLDQQTDKKRIADAIAFLDNRLEEVRTLQANAIERESLAGDAEARSFSLPPADATDKLLRYETHRDRQLYRAMDQLERLQRRRRGENVDSFRTGSMRSE